MNPVLKLILTSGFLITDETAHRYLPLVASMLKNEAINNELWGQNREANQPQIYSQNVKTVGRWDFNSEVPENSVAILNQIGEVTKYSYFCGPRGTQALVNDIEQINSNDNIIAGVFRVDSPGGEASYTDIAASAIGNSEKPIIGFVSGMAASAAYWMVSATEKIFVESKNDMLGSIGTMIFYYDYQKWFKKNGIEPKFVYASKSTNKNKDYHDLMSGNTESIIKNRLDPLNESFHDAIKNNRSGKVDSKDTETFSGMLFNAPQAKEKGLFDEYGSFEDAINAAYEIGIKNKKSSTKKTVVYV